MCACIDRYGEHASVSQCHPTPCLRGHTQRSHGGLPGSTEGTVKSLPTAAQWSWQGGASATSRSCGLRLSPCERPTPTHRDVWSPMPGTSEIWSMWKFPSRLPVRGTRALIAKEAERLMRSVFEHHPQATEKLKDLQRLGRDALAAVPCGGKEAKSTIRLAQESHNSTHL